MHPAAATCVKAGDPGVCAADCAEHASTCPQRTGGGLVFRETKERRRKTVPLPPELAAMLRSHWIAQKAERLAAANLWQDYGLVFSESDGGPPDPRDDWQEWADILQEAGVPHHGVHAARHSVDSIMIDEGIALTVVQEMLGHSHIRVTRQYVRYVIPGCQERRRPHGPGDPRHNCPQRSFPMSNQISVSGQATSRLGESNPRPTHYEEDLARPPPSTESPLSCPPGFSFRLRPRSSRVALAGALAQRRPG